MSEFKANGHELGSGAADFVMVMFDGWVWSGGEALVFHPVRIDEERRGG